MEVINFIFVVAIVVPLAVLMMYFINNLSSDVRESCKNAEAEQQAEKGGKEGQNRSSGADGRERMGARQQYPRRERAFGEETFRRPEREPSPYRQKMKTMQGDERSVEKPERKTEKRGGKHAAKSAKQPSKRKRRKERKNRRKVERDQK